MSPSFEVLSTLGGRDIRFIVNRQAQTPRSLIQAASSKPWALPMPPTLTKLSVLPCSPACTQMSHHSLTAPHSPLSLLPCLQELFKALSWVSWSVSYPQGASSLRTDMTITFRSVAHKSASQYQTDLPQFSPTYFITLLTCCPGRMTICLIPNFAVITEQLLFFLLCYLLLSTAVSSNILTITKFLIFSISTYHCWNISCLSGPPAQ